MAENAPAFSFGRAAGSPTKVAPSAEPASPGDWTLKAHQGGSRIPRAPPTTPGDQGIKQVPSCRRLPPPVVPPPPLQTLPAARAHAPALPSPPPSPPWQPLFSTPLPTPTGLPAGGREAALERMASGLEARLSRELEDQAAGAWGCWLPVGLFCCALSYRSTPFGDSHNAPCPRRPSAAADDDKRARHKARAEALAAQLARMREAHSSLAAAHHEFAQSARKVKSAEQALQQEEAADKVGGAHECWAAGAGSWGAGGAA